ncbi:MAG: transposase [Candidatus Ratteibacteria bacterium]|nr:transposase [Candidatus Ratteibacteria bacterium]
MKKTYQFRLYPTKTQEVTLTRTLSTCRHLYNNALSERRKQATSNTVLRLLQVFPWGKPDWVTKNDQMLSLTETKTEHQSEVYTQVLQDVIKRVDRSFKNFFNGFGYPRFHGRNRYNSFTYPQLGFSLNSGKLTLSKIGGIKLMQHRKIEGTIKTCTIKKDIDRWYVTFSCEIESPVPVEIKTRTGIDVGLIDLITLSNGEQVKPPKFLRASESKLIQEQRRLNRKKKGSGKRNRQKIIVAKVHRKIRNQRKDFAHKLSRQLVDSYDLIKFEDLQITNMVQNHHVAKSISDAGWYQLMNFTDYKAGYAGKFVEFVNPSGTSQTCTCGFGVAKDLSVRIHRCPSCGLVMGRDQVSAILIENRNSVYTVGTTEIKARRGLSRTREPMQRDAQAIQGRAVHGGGT